MGSEMCIRDRYRTPEEARRAASPPTSPELVRPGARDINPEILTAVGDPWLVPPIPGNGPRGGEGKYRPERAKDHHSTIRPRELIVPSRFPPTALSRAAEQEQTVYDEPLGLGLPTGPPQHQSTPGEEDELFHSLAASADPDLTDSDKKTTDSESPPTTAAANKSSTSSSCLLYTSPSPRDS